MNLLVRRSLCAAALLAAGLLAQAQAMQGGAAPVPGPVADFHNDAAAGRMGATAAVLHWHEAMVQAVQYDYVPPAPGENRVYLEHPGPTHGSRAMAIVALAVFDALNAIYGRYPSYAGVPRAPSDSSPDAAVAQAAHDALSALWTAQRPHFDKLLAEDLAKIPGGRAKWNGIDVGRQAAAANLARRAGDNAQTTDRTVGVDYFPSNLPGHWRPDPVTNSTTALGVTWGKVPPFVVPSVDQFAVAPPPALTSAAYTAAYNEVKRYGGNGTTTPTERTRDQTYAAMYWSYDGSPWVGLPMCIYNQIAAVIAQPRTRDPLEMARLMALVNAGMADGAIATWNDKYRYDVWRPVTGIRESDEGTGPTGLGDGNPATRGDPHWTPLGAQATNTSNPDFTPPFPSYPSGHSVFGGVLFEILRRFYGTDNISFTFVSEEWNGVNRDNEGWVRQRIPRTYSSLSQAESENGASRIWLGVHWRFDLASIGQGNHIGDYLFDHGLVPPGAGDACRCH